MHRWKRRMLIFTGWNFDRYMLDATLYGPGIKGLVVVQF